MFYLTTHSTHFIYENCRLFAGYTMPHLKSLQHMRYGQLSFVRRLHNASPEKPSTHEVRSIVVCSIVVCSPVTQCLTWKAFNTWGTVNCRLFVSYTMPHLKSLKHVRYGQLSFVRQLHNASPEKPSTREVRSIVVCSIVVCSPVTQCLTWKAFNMWGTVNCRLFAGYTMPHLKSLQHVRYGQLSFVRRLHNASPEKPSTREVRSIVVCSSVTQCLTWKALNTWGTVNCRLFVSYTMPHLKSLQHMRYGQLSFVRRLHNASPEKPSTHEVRSIVVCSIVVCSPVTQCLSWKAFNTWGTVNCRLFAGYTMPHLKSLQHMRYGQLSFVRRLHNASPEKPSTHEVRSIVVCSIVVCSPVTQCLTWKAFNTWGTVNCRLFAGYTMPQLESLQHMRYGQLSFVQLSFVRRLHNASAEKPSTGEVRSIVVCSPVTQCLTWKAFNTWGTVNCRLFVGYTMPHLKSLQHMRYGQLSFVQLSFVRRLHNASAEKPSTREVRSIVVCSPVTQCLTWKAFNTWGTVNCRLFISYTMPHLESLQHVRYGDTDLLLQVSAVMVVFRL